MSTKAKIQKVRSEVEAHEDRGWLKGYEGGLATREEENQALQAALEARNEKIRELKHRKKAPTTAREALWLAWELAYEVKEGQVIPAGWLYVRRSSQGHLTTFALSRDVEVQPGDVGTVRTIDPLPEPDSDWLDAPAVVAWSRWDDVRREKVWSKADECYKSTDGETIDWQDLRDVTPLWPKEAEQDEWCRAENCTWRHWLSGSVPTHKRGADCPREEKEQDA